MDLSSLSDQELLALHNQGNTQPASLASMSDADLLAAYQKMKPDAPISAAGLAKASGSGLMQGVIDLAGFPGTVGNLVSAGVSKAGNYMGVDPATVDQFKNAAKAGLSANAFTAPFATGPNADELQKAVEQITGPSYQPQNTAEKYAHTIGSFLPAVVGGPESLGSRLVARAVIPGAASEAAGELTSGTEYEPYARLGGALLGGHLGGKMIGPSLDAIPTRDQLFAAKTADYSAPEIAAVQIKPKAIQGLVADTDQQLLNAKVDKFNAPAVTGILDRLKQPRFTGVHTIDDLDLARQSLSDVPLEERRAAAIVRKSIDNYLGGGLQQSDLLAGDAAAANAKLLSARANFSAMKRSEDITNAMGRAENQAGSTYSGGNIENATRQQLRPILNEKTGVAKAKGFQDYTDAEIEALRKAVNGTKTGNVVRAVAKALGGGGGGLNTVISGATGAETYRETNDPTMAIAAALGASLGARGLNNIGNRMAVNRAAAADELLRSRAPLSAPIAASNRAKLAEQAAARIRALGLQGIIGFQQ